MADGINVWVFLNAVCSSNNLWICFTLVFCGWRYCMWSHFTDEPRTPVVVYVSNLCMFTLKFSFFYECLTVTETRLKNLKKHLSVYRNSQKSPIPHFSPDLFASAFHAQARTNICSQTIFFFPEMSYCTSASLIILLPHVWWLSHLLHICGNKHNKHATHCKQVAITFLSNPLYCF